MGVPPYPTIPTGVQLTQPGRARCRSGHIVADQKIGCWRRNAQLRRKRFGARPVRVDQAQFGNTQRDETKGHRLADATRAQHADPARRHLPERRAKGGNETGIIRVEAARPVRFEHHRIDRADGPDIRIVDPNLAGSDFLVWIGDVDTAIALRDAVGKKPRRNPCPTPPASADHR